MIEIQVVMDEAIKAEADAVLEDMGLSVADVVRTMLTRIAKDGALPFDVKISEEELALRRKAVEFARINVELEGLPIDEEFRELNERYARGEIHRKDLDKYRENRLRRIIDEQSRIH
jgi:DNA-damage-inducible protein J